MAKANPVSLAPQPPKDTPVVSVGPIIEYIGEGAELVKFSINPKAVRYVVNASGQIKEYM